MSDFKPFRTVQIAGQDILLDEEDADRVLARKWSFRKGSAYFLSYDGGNRYVYMHRFIMDEPAGSGRIVDHRHGNRLDMRKSELRITDACGNSRNAKAKTGQRTAVSGFKGVYRSHKSPPWKACITVNRKQVHVGYFWTREEAAAAYDAAAKKYHGDFARTNEIS